MKTQRSSMLVCANDGKRSLLGFPLPLSETFLGAVCKRVGVGGGVPKQSRRVWVEGGVQPGVLGAQR